MWFLKLWKRIWWNAIRSLNLSIFFVCFMSRCYPHCWTPRRKTRKTPRMLWAEFGPCKRQGTAEHSVSLHFNRCLWIPPKSCRQSCFGNREKVLGKEQRRCKNSLSKERTDSWSDSNMKTDSGDLVKIKHWTWNKISSPEVARFEFWNTIYTFTLVILQSFDAFFIHKRFRNCRSMYWSYIEICKRNSQHVFSIDSDDNFVHFHSRSIE